MAKKNVAVAKRAKITTAQKQIMLLTLGISLTLGLTIVLINHARKTISFNGKVIGAQKDAITAYNDTIKSVGICKDYDGNGKFSPAEIEKCQPNAISADEVPQSLRYNVLYQTANNPDLESVGRESLSLCYDASGKRIDYNQKQATASGDRERLLYIDLTKKCSAIRVIPEALPSKNNTEALMSSLNKIMLLSDWQPEKISPDGEAIPLDIPGIGFMPVKFSLEANPNIIHNIIENVELSIRNIDVNKAKFSWSRKGKIDFSASATAYYAEEEAYQEKTITVSPTTPTNKKKAGKK